ncbi:MAG: Signal peptidase-like protein [Bacteroidetes bacterium]|nr:Signal peptidase-like protein [Bacteroidota bacterium]
MKEEQRSQNKDERGRRKQQEKRAGGEDTTSLTQSNSDMQSETTAQNVEQGRREVPLELQKLDDSVLVYSSEEGEVAEPVPPVVTDDGHDEPSTHTVCDLDRELEGAVDVSPYTEVVFKGERRGYYLNEHALHCPEGSYVIVEAEKGIDLGMVASAGSTAYMKSRLRARPCSGEVRKLLRLATDEDINVHLTYRDSEDAAFQVCLDRIRKLALPMKLVDVEFQFDRNRITFYFTADGRVDFRQLVRELASEYRTRIELRQIGPRDEAKRMGGFGVCGRELCCSSWLGMFEPISTDMARLQNLTLNPFKLAGQCGRLKCCLNYEAQLYEELLKRFPPLEYRITTAKGEGVIQKVDVFQDAIYVHYDKANAWERLTLAEVDEVLSRKKKTDARQRTKEKSPG